MYCPHCSGRQLVCVLLAFSLSVTAQNEEKTWSFSLDTVMVSGSRYTSGVKGHADGSLRWNMQMMDDLPKMLGNADPLHYAQMLPGIQTNNEYRSGINIRGCDSQHSMVSIGGAPIYNASHLLGFFSTFNASHYEALSLYKNATTAAANRIGGELTMELPAERPDSVNGEMSVGLISSQATLRMPLGQHTGLTLSARASYLNLLYGRWLRADDQQLRYSFYDANLTLSHRINDRHLLIVDAYSGSDRMSINENDYNTDMFDRWGNNMGALHWIYEGRDGFTLHTMAYVTAYRNRFMLDMQGSEFALPSGITDAGAKSTASYRRWRWGAEAVNHHIRPQALEMSGSFNHTNGQTPDIHTQEGSLFAEYTLPLLGNLSAVAGLKGSLYHYEDGTYGAADPSIGFVYDDYVTQFSANVSTRHQYLFQTGFSNMGLPSEFWLSCNGQRPPQHAHVCSLSASRYFFGRRYRVMADAYYMHLFHQIEYSGSVLDYYNTDYDIERNLLYGKGYNCGFSLMLQKCSGRLTGWVSYAYTRARRSFPDLSMQGYYPAAHERPHEVNAVGSYSLGRHWSFGATLVYASGTPFTAPKHIAFVNKNFLIEYGEHNGSRLKPYARLDLSVNYKWHTRQVREQGVNLSVYNATAHRNELFYYISTKLSTQFAYKPVTFMLDVLPSVSYFCKF